jgi:tRNA wybutosine-synthesizing protein 4
LQDNTLNRFGAALINIDDTLVLVGGVAKDHLLSQEQGIIMWKRKSYADSNEPADIVVRTLELPKGIPQPLLVGHSVVMTGDDRVDILGGGATCFSFGTYWVRGCYTVYPDPSRNAMAPLVFQRTVEILQETSSSTVRKSIPGLAGPSITAVPRVNIESEVDFERIIREARPVILDKLELGSCVTKWSMDYLVDRIGGDRKVHDTDQEITGK